MFGAIIVAQLAVDTKELRMGTRTLAFGLIICILCIGCSASRNAVTANPALDALMDEPAFTFEVRNVEPQVTTALTRLANSGIIQPGNTIGNINVAGNGYFLSMDGDQVKANMPYYGERQMGGGYNSDSGVVFDGTAKNIKIEKDELKQRYSISFTVNGSDENYFVTVTTTANLSGEVWIRSSHRNRIRYKGAVVGLSGDEMVSR